jgi:uncharacterized protein YggE
MTRNALLFLLGVLSASSVLADEGQPPHITVFGTATAEVIPDTMVWFLNVENKGSTLENVAGEHTKAVQAALDFLKKSKVDEKTIQSSRTEFGQNWE